MNDSRNDDASCQWESLRKALFGKQPPLQFSTWDLGEFTSPEPPEEPEEDAESRKRRVYGDISAMSPSAEDVAETRRTLGELLRSPVFTHPDIHFDGLSLEPPKTSRERAEQRPEASETEGGKAED